MIAIGNYIGRKKLITSTPTPSYSPEAQAYFDRVEAVGETLQTSRKTILDARISQSVAAGWWSKLDGFWLLANIGYNSAQLNLIADEFNLTPSAIGALTATGDIGVEGNGANTYYKTGFIPNSGVHKYTQDSATIGFYCTENVSGSGNALGVNDGNNPTYTGMSYINPRDATNKLLIRLNSSAAASSIASPTSIGQFAAVRTGGTNVNCYIGTAKTSISQASNGLSQFEYYFFARNNAGTFTLPDGKIYGYYFLGGALTDADIASIKTIWAEGYLVDIVQDLFNVTTLTKAQVTVDTYDGSDQTVHPSVVAIPAGWNGYKYWMAITPYPDGDADFENPSIYCSNDGSTWATPVGLTNPVVAALVSPLYNADPHLYYENNKLYLAWVTSESPYSVYLIESTDGVVWSAKTTIATIGAGETTISVPSILKVGSYYYLYYTSAYDPTVIKRRRASNIYGPYSNTQTISLTPFFPNKINHPMFKYYNSKYYVTYNQYTVNKNGPSIWMGVSSDGLEFIKDTNAIVLKTTAPEDTFYISCFETIEGTVKLYYSVIDASDEWWLMWATLTII